MSFMKVKLLGLHLKSRFYVNVYVFNRVLKSRAIYCCCSVVESCLTFCDPMDCSLPGFPFLHYLPETKARLKGIHIGKKEVKWSLFPTTWSYISKTQKISQKESLRLIKFRGCRIQKSTLKNQAAFPYTNKEHMERKLINNSTYNTIKKNKILRDKLNQAMRQKTYILKTKKHCWEKLKKIQANGKTSHVQEL